MADKGFKKRFTFTWKDGDVLDFKYEGEKEPDFNSEFDFDDLSCECDKCDCMVPPDPIPEPVPSLLEEKPKDAAGLNTPTLTETVIPVVTLETPVVADPVIASVVPEADNAPLDIHANIPATLEDVKIDVPTNEANSASVVPEPVVIPERIVTTLVDQDLPQFPTVKLTFPEKIPQIAVVTATALTDTVDTKSTDPQIHIELTDGSVKIPEGSRIDVLGTEEHKSDIVVAIPPEAEEVLKKVGVDPVDVLSIATFADSDVHHPDLPDLTPTEGEQPADVIPQVVGLKVDGDTVHLTNVSADVPVDDGTKLVPIDTPPDLPNIIAAIDAETQEQFAKKGLDPAEELKKFLEESGTEIATVKPIDPVVVAETFGYDLGKESDAEPTTRFVRDWASEE